MTRPPYSFLTGSQTLLVRKPRPYLLIAGQAPITRDTRMPASRLSVSQAAPCAAQPKSRSTRGLLRTALPGGGLVISRPVALAGWSKAVRLAGSVEDTLRNPYGV